MKYKYILILYHNWNKTCGWSRWAARLTSTETGKQWCGIIPHESNLMAALTGVLGSMESVYYFAIKDMKLTDFRSQTVGFEPEAGTKELAARIKAALDIQ